MKCDRIASVLEDYHYGELAPSEAAEVATHLMECAACRQQLSQLEKETKVYETYGALLEKDLPSASDLWQGILQKESDSAARSSSNAQGWRSLMRPGSSWAFQAIAAMLLVAVSVAGTLLFVEHRRTAEIQISQQAPGSSTQDKSLNEALISIQRAEQDYLKAIQQLNALVEKQKASLDPRIYAELQVNLKMIDDHITATRKAYYAHPQDAELALYMLAAYSRKVALLQDLTS